MPKIIATETEQHKAAFQTFASMGQRRTLAEVARKLGISKTTVKAWAHSFGWAARVSEYDARHEPTQDDTHRPLSIRVDPATMARLDAYAERNGRRRSWAVTQAIIAGMDAIEAVPRSAAVAAATGIDAAAVRLLSKELTERLGPMLVDAVAYGLALRDDVK